MVVSNRGLAQELQPADSVAIERAATAYVLPTLPDGVVGFDGTAFDRNGRITARAPSRIDALARALGASKVRTDSVITCPGDPSTCRMSVDAIVRVGEPYASPEGARVVVEVHRRTESARRPIYRLALELILSKKDGSWKVIGIGQRNAS
jgi:hypothetical protein